MTTRNQTGVTPGEIERIAEFARELLPSGDSLPQMAGLSDLGAWLMTALQERSDLVPDIRVALVTTSSLKTPDALSYLAASQPTKYEALKSVIAGAYLLHPDVRLAMGYPGQVPLALRADIDEYASMLEKVFDRGDRYRATPD